MTLVETLWEQVLAVHQRFLKIIYTNLLRHDHLVLVTPLHRSALQNTTISNMKDLRTLV
jgi:hypothetical protein